MAFGELSAIAEAVASPYRGEDGAERVLHRHLVELAAAMAAHKLSLEDYCSRFRSVVQYLPAMDKNKQIRLFCSGFDPKMGDALVYRIYGKDGLPSLEKAIHIAHMLQRSAVQKKCREAREARVRLPAEIAAATCHVALHEVPRVAMHAYSAGQQAIHNMPPISVEQMKDRISSFYENLVSHTSGKSETSELSEEEQREAATADALEEVFRNSAKPVESIMGGGTPHWVAMQNELQWSRAGHHALRHAGVVCR